MENKQIKGLRIELGLSQEKFAQLLGVSLQTVRRWEEGLTKPLPILSLKLEELRKRLGACRSWLWGQPFRQECYSG